MDGSAISIIPGRSQARASRPGETGLALFRQMYSRYRYVALALNLGPERVEGEGRMAG